MKGIYDTRIHLFSSNTDRFTKRRTFPGIFYTDAQGFTCFELEFTHRDSEKGHNEIAEGFFLAIEGCTSTGLIYTPDGSELSSHERSNELADECSSNETNNSFMSDVSGLEKHMNELNKFPNPLLELHNSLRCYKIVSLYFKEKRPKKAVCKTVRVPFTDVPHHETHLVKLITEDYSNAINVSEAG